MARMYYDADARIEDLGTAQGRRSSATAARATPTP